MTTAAESPGSVKGGCTLTFAFHGANTSVAPWQAAGQVTHSRELAASVSHKCFQGTISQNPGMF